MLVPKIERSSRRKWSFWHFDIEIRKKKNTRERTNQLLFTFEKPRTSVVAIFKKESGRSARSGARRDADAAFVSTTARVEGSQPLWSASLGRHKESAHTETRRKRKRQREERWLGGGKRVVQRRVAFVARVAARAGGRRVVDDCTGWKR